MRFLAITVILFLAYFAVAECVKKCGQPKKCNKNKYIRCSKPPKNGQQCPTYQCKEKAYKSKITGKKCSNKCPIYCNDNEIKCPGEFNKQGCYNGDKCIPKTVGCNDSFCPLDCPSGQKECPTGYLQDGCPKATECIPKFDSNGCPRHCPIFCKPRFVQCPGVAGPNGCLLPPSCIIEKNGNCSSLCPIHCDPDELLCAGKESSNGCKTPDYCIPKIIDECPGHCPIECPNGFIKCSKGQDVSGCSMGDECIAEFDPISNGPTRCPKCAEGHTFCHLGYSAANISIHSQCFKIPKNLDHCASVCPPPPCKDTETACPLGTDGKGCPLWFQCLDKSGGCPTCPPAVCQGGTSDCVSSMADIVLSGNVDTLSAIDECGNSLNPMLTSCSIPGKEECPEVCKEQCTSGFHPCSVPTPVGCMKAASCVSNYNGASCSQGCPDECAVDEFECFSDPHGSLCPPVRTCQPAFDSEGCPLTCPVTCGFLTEQLCTRHINASTTCKEYFCVSTHDETGCSQGCPEQSECPDGTHECLIPASFQCPGYRQCKTNLGHSGCPTKCNNLCKNGEGICERPYEFYPSCIETYCSPMRNELGCILSCQNLTCLSDQIKCSFSKEGCPNYEVCYDTKDYSTGCFVGCPIKCENGLKKCEKMITNGSSCYIEEFCQSFYDDQGCFLSCPSMNCAAVDQQNCFKKGPAGCPDIEYCHDIKDQASGCFVGCPQENCQDGSQLCKRTISEGSSCTIEEFCQPLVDESGCEMSCPSLACTSSEQKCLVKGVNGCPDKEDCLSKYDLHSGCSVGCPVQCADDSQICQSKTMTSSFSCILEQSCHPMEDDNGCQLTCPDFQCTGKNGETACPIPGLNGCPDTKACFPAYENGCSKSCPVPCNTTSSRICSTKIDHEDGTCRVEEKCVPFYDGNNCQLSCPGLACSWPFQKCASRLTDECPFYERCLFQYAGECQIGCPAKCSNGDRKCKRNVTIESGCFIEGYCSPSYDEQGCTYFCPGEVLECSEDDQVCTLPDVGPDCPNYDVCYPKYLNDGCPAYCNPSCFLIGKKTCYGSLQADGCNGSSYCVDKNATCTN